MMKSRFANFLRRQALVSVVVEPPEPESAESEGSFFARHLAVAIRVELLHELIHKLLQLLIAFRRILRLYCGDRVLPRLRHIEKRDGQSVIVLAMDHGLSIDGDTTRELYFPRRTFKGRNEFVIPNSACISAFGGN